MWKTGTQWKGIEAEKPVRVGGQAEQEEEAKEWKKGVQWGGWCGLMATGWEKHRNTLSPSGPVGVCDHLTVVSPCLFCRHYRSKGLSNLEVRQAFGICDFILKNYRCKLTFNSFLLDMASHWPSCLLLECSDSLRSSHQLRVQSWLWTYL